MKVHKEYKAEIDRLLKESSVEVEHLQGALGSAKYASMKMKEELASELEKRKKAEAIIFKGERRIAEAKEQIILDFKALKELEDIKIKFAKEAFVKGFELCQKRVAEKFSELDLGFLGKESFEDEMEPSTSANLSPTKFAATEPANSAVAPSEVKDL